ncbi:MAG: holo-ACP synthase [Pseudomonadota bacterium]
MILGVGSDLCVIARVEKMVKKYRERFINRLFHQYEIAYSERHKKRAIARYSMLFAAKEAASKALGTGMLRHQITWRSFEVQHHETGQPWLKFHGSANHHLHRLCPHNFIPQASLSLSDDGGMAHAMVVIWALSKSNA